MQQYTNFVNRTCNIIEIKVKQLQSQYTPIMDSSYPSATTCVRESDCTNFPLCAAKSQ